MIDHLPAEDDRDSGQRTPERAAEMTTHFASIGSSLLICGLSFRSTFSNELNFYVAIVLMKPRSGNLFIKLLTRERVVPIISARRFLAEFPLNFSVVTMVGHDTAAACCLSDAVMMVSLFGDIVGVSFGSYGVSRRHHRSPRTGETAGNTIVAPLCVQYLDCLKRSCVS